MSRRRYDKRTSVLLAERLSALASEFIGDGNACNVFFVTDAADVVTVTYDYHTARDHYRALARRRPLQECALEDRLYGVIASVSPIEEGSSTLRYENAPEEYRA